jgi:glycopeptide antibiotics resistance protein
MDELFRHWIVFFLLFFFIRLKYKKYTIILFLLLPLIGEVVQIFFHANWGFVFEWEDVLLNYLSAGMGWSVVAALRENQKIEYFQKYLRRNS